MALKGDLSTIDLSHVFQMLMLSERAGTLEIQARGRRTPLYFDGAGIVFPYDREAFPEKALLFLVRCGLVPEERLAEAARRGGRGGRALLTTLTDMGVLDQGQVEAAFRAQSEEEICDLFFAREGTFEFLEGQVPDAPGLMLDREAVLPVQSLLMEAARRVDEWERIDDLLPSGRSVFEQAASLSDLEGDEDPTATAEVFGLVNGLTPVDQLLEKTRLTRYQVLRSLALLVEQRVVYEVSVDVLLEAAREHLAADRPADALPLVERAIERGVNDSAALEMAARANVATKKIRRAGLLLAQLAAQHDEAEESEAAAGRWLEVRKLLPTHVEAREWLHRHALADLAWGVQHEWDARREAAELAAILHAIDRPEDARSVLTAQLEAHQGDWKTVQAMARAASEIGDARTAVEILWEAAEAYRHKRLWPQATQLLRRVRAIDPHREGLEALLRECEQRTETERPKPKRFLRVAAILLLLGGGEFFWWHYDGQALDAYFANDAEELALEGDFAGARSELEALKEAHPVSVAFLLASRKLGELDAREQAFLARAQEVSDALTREREETQSRAERWAAEALEHVRSGDYPMGLAMLDKVVALQPDPEWLAQARVLERASDLRAYLESADALYETWKQGLVDGAWEDAHVAAVTLLDQHPLAPHAKEVDLPVRIEVEPEGSRIVFSQRGFADSTRRETVAPANLRWPATAVVDVEIEHSGYQSRSLEVVPRDGWLHRVRLERMAEPIGVLPHTPRWSPQVRGTHWWMGCENGRVLVFDPATQDVLWSRVLPDLDELSDAPVIDAAGVWVTGRGGVLHRWGLDGSDGMVAALDGVPDGALVTGHGVAVLPVQRADQRMLVAIDGTDGTTRWDAPLESEGPCHLVKTSAGFIAVCDESMWRINPADGATLAVRTLSSPVAAVATLDDALAVALHDGTVVGGPHDADAWSWSEQVLAGAVEGLMSRGANWLASGPTGAALIQPDGAIVTKWDVGSVESGSLVGADGTLWVPRSNERVERHREGEPPEIVHVTQEPRFLLEWGATVWVLGTEGGVFRIGAPR